MLNPVVWLIDSGCGNHITWNPALFQCLMPVSFLPTFVAANGSALKATHIGTIGSVSDKLFIPDTILVPELRCNLISVGQLCNQGARVTFSSSVCIIEDCSTGNVVGRGHKVGNHFVLDELNMSHLEGTERRQQMLPLAMPNVTNPSSNWAQRNEALNNSSQQLMNATSEANNQKELKRRTTDENIAVQPPEVHKLETTLGWIESELMDDRLEISDDDSFLIDLEVYKHNLWMLAFN